MLPRLFEMFSQATPALSRSQGGLGIGLSLVKGLVELHGGTVEAHSIGSGQGSEFVVRLPVLVQFQPADLVSPQPMEVVASSPKLRILIADDNYDGANTLSRMLQMLGYETHTAYDGENAFALAEK